MKKTSFIIVVLVAVLVLSSCSFNKHEEGVEQTRSLIKVQFSPSQTRALSAGYPDFGTVYLLTATPNFERNGRTIVGAVTKEELTPDAQGNINAGYFEEGSWKFVLEAVLKKDKATSEVIASQTLENVYISEKNKNISFTLSDVISAEGTGNIKVSIMVPQLSAQGENNFGVSLIAYVDGTAKAFKSTPTVKEATATEGTDLLQFDGMLEGVSSGCHTIKLEYKLGDTSICSQAVEVRVVKDAEVLISGSMLNGEYVSGSITVTYDSDKWTLSVTSTPNDAVVKANANATLTAAVSLQGSNPTYQWYVDGEKIDGATNSSYTFKSSALGIFSVTCVAKIGSIMKSSTVYVYVNSTN